jgi:hypothetical protein
MPKTIIALNERFVKMIIYIGLDDTDIIGSRGTGRLARAIADLLSCDYAILGVVRHQLLVDPRVPYTSHNSCAVILLEGSHNASLQALFSNVSEMMMADFQPGSDPGLCISAYVPEDVTLFGKRAQTALVTQQEAYALAAEHELLLAGLGGSKDGVIGALAGVGLSASGNDGRYIQVGCVRELTGLQTIESILTAGVTAVETVEGLPVDQGMIMADKIRPARRDGKPVALVNWAETYWQPVKPER